MSYQIHCNSPALSCVGDTERGDQTGETGEEIRRLWRLAVVEMKGCRSCLDLSLLAIRLNYQTCSDSSLYLYQSDRLQTTEEEPRQERILIQ